MSVSDACCTGVVFYNNPGDSLPSKCCPGQSAEVSCLQGDGDCWYLHPEGNHRCNALTNIICSLGKDTTSLS